EVLREDNRAIVRAASQASKAADYLLSFLPEHDQPAVSVDTGEREAALCARRLHRAGDAAGRRLRHPPQPVMRPRRRAAPPHASSRGISSPTPSGSLPEHGTSCRRETPILATPFSNSSDALSSSR